ncbi:nickel-dependent hydrogenase large subunit [Desulfonatronovibrio hydrogenovorans]|uniref:hydrogenase large subunit n=1 Tax=Desulfonatronovibrio hydrogenovorans TaxID=53245 RepID=UPI000490BFA8|nr:nickel-dependent hydrogenase large subunit [Desulfonatronovibrio hydrogenovorans]
MARTIIPFGPQHPVLPEPIHLKLTIEDEIITEVLPGFGYVHRGLETLVTKKDFRQMVQVVERVCGICSCIQALTYVQALEDLYQAEIPPRAKFLRVIWSELHRMHSHLLWLGLFADAFGFESLFMQCWRIREKIMDLQEATAGNRVIISVNIIGGTRYDLDQDQCRQILTTLKGVEKDFLELQKVFFNDYTVLKRTKGIAVLTQKEAYELGCVGPMLRASNIAQDTRMTGYAAYGELEFEPVVETEGDCLARTRVRFREVLQAMDLVRQAISKLPDTEIAVKIKGNPQGEAVSRTEQPRGELVHYILANGTKNLDRLRIRTPTFANTPALLKMLPGQELASAPVILMSIDPCISCTER